MNKKRILYIESNTDGTIGGSYYSLLYLLEGLDKEKYVPVVLFCQDNSLIPRYREYVDEILVYNYDPFDSNPLRSWKAVPRFVKYVLLKQFALKRIIRQLRPDLVHLNDGYDSNHEWVLACMVNGIPIIAHDRGTRPPATLQTRFFTRYMDAIIAVSEANRSIIEGDGLRPKRIRRVYNGLDMSDFEKHSSPEQRRATRDGLGIGDDGILVGMVGNIDTWKGQIVFARAMDRVMKHRGNVHGIVVGKTAKGAEAYERTIRTFLAENGMEERLRLLGYRSDIPQLLNAMDIFVHTSVEPEPFGRVILEAMAMRKPIVSISSGGPVELITHGDSGFLVPMGDHEAVAGAVEECLADMSMAEAMGEKAYQRIRDNFTLEHMVKGVERVYEEVFKERE